MSGRLSYTHKSRFAQWLDARLPLPRLIHDQFIAFQTPRNLNVWYTFGAILAFCLGIQIVTGIVLAMHYAANAELAFDAIEHIMRDVNYGWLIRSIHANGASMFFIALYIHMFRGLYYGSYRAPRELLWIIGVIIYLLMMAIAFLGYVLPWSQTSFWGATVIVPWLDTSPTRSNRFRPLMKRLFWGLVIASVLLAYCGAQPADAVVGGVPWIVRLATLYYFGFFWLIMPLIATIEVPDKLPASIAHQYTLVPSRRTFTALSCGPRTELSGQSHPQSRDRRQYSEPPDVDVHKLFENPRRAPRCSASPQRRIRCL